jgi:hypothetical protein
MHDIDALLRILSPDVAWANGRTVRHVYTLSRGLIARMEIAG